MNPEEQEYNRLWNEVRKQDTATAEVPPQQKKTFETLPDGQYAGRVHIQADTVGSEKSPNFGRKKYAISLTVVDGEMKGKMAYNHRVILPHNLASMPPDNDPEKLAIWRSEVKTYLRQTDKILKACGVEVSDTDMNRFILRIAENNRRKPIVDFTMRNGVPYINHLIQTESEADKDGLFTPDLPDGNDLPLH